jgi:hypothetical protein
MRGATVETKIPFLLLRKREISQNLVYFDEYIFISRKISRKNWRKGQDSHFQPYAEHITNMHAKKAQHKVISHPTLILGALFVLV